LPLRLSVMMFLQWSVPAAVAPLLSVRLAHDLGFGPRLTGALCATSTVASVASALLAGQVADRWLSAEKAMSLCAAVAGVDLLILAELRRADAVFLAILLYGLVTGPMLLFGTTLCFAHLPDPRRQFGPVRLWGTVGWMAVGWLLRFWPDDPLRLGGLIALALSAYGLTLPYTPPRQLTDPSRRFAPLEAIHLLGNPTFAIYCVCLLGACVTFPFTTQSTPLLLDDLGVPRDWLAATMTLSQTTEVGTLALLPVLLPRLGVRGTMAVGLGAWLAAMCILAVGRPLELVVASLVLNGLFVTGFLIAGQVYVNSLARDDFRASVQGLFSCLNGLGQLAGHLLAGWLRERSGGQVPPTFAVAAILTACLLLLFLAGFRPSDPRVGAGEPQ
jgi:predicted MFS family arabinose efflux permease